MSDTTTELQERLKLLGFESFKDFFDHNGTIWVYGIRDITIRSLGGLHKALLHTALWDNPHSVDVVR